MLCKYALLHTSISCYTSTVTSIFHIAVCHTPCGVTINKDTCDLLYFQFSVLCLQDKFPVTWLHISCVCVCLFPWGPLLGGTYYLKSYTWQKLGLKAQRFQLWGLFVSPVNSLCDTGGVRGQLKAWHQSCTRNNDIRTVGEEKEERWHCRFSPRHDVLSLPPGQIGSIQSLKLNPQNPPFFFFCSSESMLGLNICLYSK